MTLARAALPLFCAALALGACSESSAGGDPVPQAPAASLEPATETETATSAPRPDPPPCDEAPSSPALTELPAGSADALIALSADIFPCADSVVLVEEGALASYVEAAQIATAVEAPLLLYSDGVIDEAVRAELSRLAPSRLRIYGSLAPGQRAGLPNHVVIATALREQNEAVGAALSDGLRELSRTASEAPSGGPVFVVGADDAHAALLVLPHAAAAGSDILLAEPDDPESLAEIGRASARGAELLIASDMDPTARWRVELAIAGTELPGGGVEVFPHRRIVAFYGSPATRRLGALGEQGPEETLSRMAPIVDSYRTDDNPLVIPAFEIIATVADSSPGRDGDYSQELAVERIRPWIDVAVEHDVFVLIDLQPGREHFLSQAQKYEELLVLPNVGLALDPEWRLGPDEQPLRRIGSVSASEVNEVVDWLAQLVRDHALPQKPLVIHQFQRRMVPDRELVQTPPELAVVVHVDGQGGLASKFNTYASVTGQETTDDQTLWWGWKNFYDEDRPMARPDQVEQADPTPLVITFQ